MDLSMMLNIALPAGLVLLVVLIVLRNKNKSKG
jgi:hypothetical protein